MKKILMLMVLFVGFSFQAKADTNFDYTGKYALNEGSVNSPQYYSTTTLGSIGGPSNDGGAAEQFSISSVTTISDLDVNAIVFGSGNPPSPSSTPTTFVYQLYSGSSDTVHGVTNPNEPVPDLATLMTTSSPLSFPDPSATSATATSTTYNNIDVPFNTTLQPGTYWLAEVGNGAAVVDPTQSYIDPSGTGNTAQTPEPLMGVLFVAFLLFIVWKGKKYVAME